MMKKLDGARLAGLLGVLLAATIADVSVAHAQDGGFRGRIWVGAVGRYVLTDNDPFTSPGFGTTELKVDGSALGFGADGEFKFNRWIGIDAAIAYAKLNVLFTTSNTPGTSYANDFGIAPVLVSLNLHVIHTDAVDLWVGPQVGYVLFPDDLSYAVTGGGTFTYKAKSVFSKKGFATGADIGLGKTVALNLGFRWQNADGDSDGHLTVDPTLVTIGLTKKF
jgi:hypothetical protein